MKKLILQLSVLFICLFVLINIYYQGKFSTDSSINKEERKQSGADKQLAMWFQGRAYPDPFFMNDKYQRGWEQAQNIRKQQYGLRTKSSSWVSMGPSDNIGGRVLTVAINPLRSNSLFIGTASGGIWKSYSGGVGTKAWQPVETNLPLLGVSSIIINPLDTNVIYAGTGEVYRVDTSNIGFNVWKCRGTYGIGILKSTNAGANWSQVMMKSTSELFGIQMLKFNPHNINSVYACATDGLYRTGDGGGSWTKILDKIYVTDIVINPADTTQMVVAVGNMVNSDKGIYRTVNGGSTWSKITSGLPSSFLGFTCLENWGDTRIYASIGGTTDELYVSLDFGVTWTAKNTSAHCGGQYWFSHALAIKPTDFDSIIMGGVNYFVYENGPGSTGSRISLGAMHSDVHDIEFDPSNAQIVYLACDGGMYKSTNAGSSFTKINGGLSAVQFYAPFATHPTNPDIMIGGLQDNAVVYYDGSTWSTIIGGDGGPCLFSPTNGNIVFASRDARYVSRSTTGVTGSFSEELMTWAFNADDRTGFMAPIAISKSNPNYVYCASDNLHRSTNAGASWTNDNYTTAVNYIDQRHKTGVALAVSPTDHLKLYVSVSPFSQRNDDDLNVVGQPNILKSTNGGTTFPLTSIKNGLPDRFVMDFAISPTFDDSVFIVLSGFVDGSGTSHVYVTGNGGTTWTSIGTGLPDVPFNAILIDPVDQNVIYAGSDLGVYVSPDRGLNWYDFNNGLWDATLIMDLQATADNQIVAATHGKGVFKTVRFTGTLPVTITSFIGSNQDNQNKLKWTTENETNLKQYELERSLDGNLFTKLTTVIAKNQNGTHTYEYSDFINSSVRALYHYRLKSINLDGSAKYSRIITLEVLNKKPFNVLTNPFNETIKINARLNQHEVIILNLYDAKGSLIRSETHNGEIGINAITIDNIGSLSKGMYIIEAILDRQRYSIKLTKN